jgi:CheY-like chemotaxis protein
VKKKILVADGSDVDGRTTAILAQHDLQFVRTLDNAKQALLAGDFDLIIVGVHFDESRMFDLLRHIRGEPQTRDMPVVCVLSHRFETAVTIQSLEIAAATLAANAFVDYAEHPDNDEGNAAIRDIVERCLHA